MPANRNAPHQTVPMSRLISAFTVRIWHKSTPPPPPPSHALHHIFSVIGDRRYQPFGCYYSPKNHALPNQVGNLRGSIDWNNMTGIIQWCAKLSTEYELFGIEFYGECYAALTTDDANLSAGTVASGDDYNLLCWHGVGANNVMYIYQWIN